MAVRRFDQFTQTRVVWFQWELNGGIQAPVSFWRQHRDAFFATLALLGDGYSLSPFWVVQRDWRAWFILVGPPIAGQAEEDSRAGLLDPHGFT